LHSCTIGNGFVGVDGFVGFLAIEKVGHHLLDLGDTGTNEREGQNAYTRLMTLPL
jgi:hypothetical protein